MWLASQLAPPPAGSLSGGMAWLVLLVTGLLAGVPRAAAPGVLTVGYVQPFLPLAALAPLGWPAFAGEFICPKFGPRVWMMSEFGPISVFETPYPSGGDGPESDAAMTLMTVINAPKAHGMG
jgi:hypothetical protein